MSLPSTICAEEPLGAGHSPLTLAFVGDAVFSLLTRARLARQSAWPPAKMHSQSAAQVCAKAQAAAVQKLLPLLTEEERNQLRRGRNAHAGRQPKGATAEEYHAATGLEALFGALYLAGREARILELFEALDFAPISTVV